MDIARRGRNVAKGRAALLRFRQKAGLIRVDPVADRLRDSGIDVATIYGRDRFDPEAERLRFQTGQAKVCVFTTVASISLHAGETLADGRRASAEPRPPTLSAPTPPVSPTSPSSSEPTGCRTRP